MPAAPLPWLASMKQHEMPLVDLGKGTGLRAAGRWSVMAVIAMVAVLALATCGGSKAGPGATVPRPTTTTTISVATVPEVITVAYAQAVMDELDRVLGDAIRELVASKGPSDAFVARLKAVYADPQYSKEASLYGEDAANDFKGYRIPPGNPSTRVKEIVGSSRSCLIVLARRSLSEFFVDSAPEDSKDAVVELRVASAEPASEFTRTQWRIRGEGTRGASALPEKPCGA